MKNEKYFFVPRFIFEKKYISKFLKKYSDFLRLHCFAQKTSTATKCKFIQKKKELSKKDFSMRDEN